MTREAAAYLSLVGVWCSGAILLTLRARRRSITCERRYRMFAIRDRLFMLVAQEVVSENDPVFRTTCAFVNGLISDIRDGNLKAFAQDFLTAEHRAFTEPNKRNAQAFVEAAARAPEPLQEVLDDFFDSVVRLLAEASLLLRVLLRLRAHLIRRNRAKASRAAQRLSYKPVVYRAYVKAEELGKRLRRNDQAALTGV